ncbi:hypothetical protein [Cellulomonas triticagri]|uniref:Uncharacterized protein n=1 Tax=Cellulomonas triticagri TaxID=2483352 RepID=A0A3M2J9V9_9CELL|nr:hypothetical protein [Cellulomonas triticagri]RMI09744.1 hypothetical protein EBM89_09160 [Cellulomonas triticagri]
MTQALAAAEQLVDLRRRRSALRLEHQHVVRWRRLVRDRLELAVAAAAPPAPPGVCADVRATLGASAHDVPAAAELAAAVRGALPVAEVHELPHLRDLDMRLARYEMRLEDSLRDLTDQYIEQLAREVTETGTESLRGAARAR